MREQLWPRSARQILGGLLPLLIGLVAVGARGEELPLDAAKSSVIFVGEAFLHNFHGQAKELSGQATFDPTAVPPVQKALLHFKTAALTTFHEARDQKMYAWLQVAAQPNATFRLEAVRLVSGEVEKASAEKPARFRVEGSFTLHGITKPISGTASGWRANDRLVVSGDVIIDTLAYGLPQIREMLMTVGTNVEVTYRFAFVLPRDFRKRD